MILTRRRLLSALALGAGASALRPLSALASARTTRPALGPDALWASMVRTPAVATTKVPLQAVHGAIPPGLSGRLFRIGPGRLTRGGLDCGHWFDGDGCVVGVDIGPEGAWGQVRYVETEAYLKEERAGRYLYPGYGTTLPGHPARSSIARIKNAANTALLPLDGQLLALWEGGNPHALDPEDLTTLGPTTLGHMAEGEPFSAHPKIDPLTGEITTYGLIGGPEMRIRVHRLSPQGALIAQGEVTPTLGGMVHDFTVAGPYVIFLLPPIRLKPAGALFGVKSLNECLEWVDGAPTEVIVLSRETLTEVTRFEVDPLFFWHTANAEVLGDELHLSLVEMEDFHNNDAWFSEIPGGAPTTPHGNIGIFTRLRLDLARGRLLERSPIHPMSAEFPTLHPTDLALRRSEALMALNDRSPVTPLDLHNGIGRVDVESGDLDRWSAGEDAVVSEALYAPDQRTPGLNWALTLTWEAGRGSFVDILDASALAQGPVCRLALPVALFTTFHGAWIPA